MDAFADARNRRIAVHTSSQVGKTSILENIIGYHVDLDPGPILVIQPTLDMGETFSKDRLVPMVRDTKVLNGKIADPRSRDSGNTILHKVFRGGHITIAGANAPTKLASRPIRILLCDEVDRFPASSGVEGDPVKLAIKRTNNFWNRRIGLFSTPTDEDVGIDAEFKQSDQRYFYVKCPDCEHSQRLVWAQVKWTEPSDAKYACESCGSLWDEAIRDRVVSNGEWKATASFNGVAGFHINELYSPWRSFGDVVMEFLEAKDEPEKLRVWVNTSLGEPWKQETTGISAQALESEGGTKMGAIPDGALALSLGVDTQGNRLALQLVGFGRNNEQWTIDYVELPGDPNLDEAWHKLTEYRRQEFDHPLGGKLKISMTAIDSGGHHAQKVVSYAREFRSEGVIAVKGASTPLPTMLKSKPSKVDYKADGKVFKKSGEVWLVGTDTAKSYLMSKLRVDSDRRKIHFAEGLGSEFFRQLTAENYDKRRRKWVNPKRKRNEALDTLVYATAATLHPWLRLDVATEAKWRALEARLTQEKSDGAPKPPEIEVKTQQKPAASRFFNARKGFISNW
jgi:phage terminase large subunit GpA-like protein